MHLFSDSTDSSPVTFDSEEVLGEFGGKKTYTPYADYLLAENQKINLVSRETSPAELYRMIADCLIPLKTDELTDMLKVGAKLSLLDIASGGGLPGIPLALALRSVGIEPYLTLVERTGKKARFLNRALNQLGLSGQVIAEDFQTSVNSGPLKAMTGSFDLVCLRWVKPDSKLVSVIISALKPTGRFVYYAALPPGVSDQTDRSVRLRRLHRLRRLFRLLSTFSYKLSGDERESRTLTILSQP